MARTMSEIRKMRDEEVLAIAACIKKSPVPMKAVEIAEEVGITPRRVWDLMSSYVMTKYPEITNIRNSEGHYNGYIWKDPNAVDETVEETAEEEIKEETKAEDRKNSEGYPDPTASAAMKSFQSGKIRQGSIWETNGDTYFLVLSVMPGLANGLAIAKIDEWYDPEYDLTVYLNNERHYINMRRLTNRPTKTLSRMFGMLDQKRIIKIKVSIGDMLGLNVETEKIVEKPVEVVKEVVKEVPVEKVIFKTKFDRKKLRKAGIKAYKPVDVEKYQQLVKNAEERYKYMCNKCAVEQAKADAWEKAFTLLTTKGENHVG